MTTPNDAADLDAKMESTFQGNYLDATDFIGRGEIAMEILSVTPPNEEKDATGKTINKSVIRFSRNGKPATKALVCNKTNAKIIALQYGKKPSQWVGKTVVLTVRYLKEAFGQKNVPVVRIKAPENAPIPFGMRKNYGSVTPFDR